MSLKLHLSKLEAHKSILGAEAQSIQILMDKYRVEMQVRPDLEEEYREYEDRLVLVNAELEAIEEQMCRLEGRCSI